jgi:CRISPR/Cas system CSM-associated protein Csm5 (group 7 of RAMP superfamily)
LFTAAAAVLVEVAKSRMLRDSKLAADATAYTAAHASAYLHTRITHTNSSAKDCKRMGLNNFDIVVENPQGVYYPGSTIMGVVRITIVGEAKKVRGECELRPP